MRLAGWLLSGLALSSSGAFAAGGKHQDLESCYQAYGQLESTQQGGKKVEVYKTQAEVAADCNQRVIARAKQEKSLTEVLALATVIGTNSNWQSAMPVYTVGVQRDPKKESCVGKDQLYALDLALASPADNDHARSGVSFMQACWPKAEKALVDMLKASSGYTKTNLCTFLQSKKALPAAHKDLCTAH